MAFEFKPVDLEATLEATIIKADGTKIDLGVISKTKVPSSVPIVPFATIDCKPEPKKLQED